MQRREFVTAVGGVSLLGISGCLSSGDEGSENSGPMRGSTSDCTITESTDAVEPVSLSTDGRLRGADVVVDLKWNARTQATIDTGEGTYYEPPSEESRVLVVRSEISNPTDSEVYIRPSSLQLTRETPNAVLDDLVTPFAISGYTDALDEMTLKPNATVDRLILFDVENPDVTSATIEPRPISEMERTYAESNDEELRTTLAFNPTCDESLEIGAPPQQ
jgi:hypothetical protein